MQGVRLTAMQRKVHELYFVAGLRQVEIAALLKMSQPAVAMRLQRIRQRYRRGGFKPPTNPGFGLAVDNSMALSNFTCI